VFPYFRVLVSLFSDSSGLSRMLDSEMKLLTGFWEFYNDAQRSSTLSTLTNTATLRGRAIAALLPFSKMTENVDRTARSVVIFRPIRWFMFLWVAPYQWSYVNSAIVTTWDFAFSQQRAFILIVDVDTRSTTDRAPSTPGQLLNVHVRYSHYGSTGGGSMQDKWSKKDHQGRKGREDELEWPVTLHAFWRRHHV